MTNADILAWLSQVVNTYTGGSPIHNLLYIYCTSSHRKTANLVPPSDISHTDFLLLLQSPGCDTALNCTSTWDLFVFSKSYATYVLTQITARSCRLQYAGFSLSMRLQCRDPIGSSFYLLITAFKPNLEKSYVDSIFTSRASGNNARNVKRLNASHNPF